MLEGLKRSVLEANLALERHGLVVLTWGNASGIDCESGLAAIKPSGVPYGSMTADDIVIVNPDGNVVEGRYRPSSDLPTHLWLYKALPGIGGIVHTHSTYATAFAQAGIPIPALGTTHADVFRGDVPCTRQLTDDEITKDYELNTGRVIAETAVNYLEIPAVLVRGHGLFTWGKTPEEAAEAAVVAEESAKAAFLTLALDKDAGRIPDILIDKHYFRKHGNNAYYGQK
ncbi:MAG: L-ribulose-5-phosphate 4-epimerase AraD [Clostridia bacterium]|nr:L-ribulose-5-phosphate 4-epimerase AraD [Clostridia bacterium]